MRTGPRRSSPRSGWLLRLLRPLRPGDPLAPGWRLAAVSDEPPRLELDGPRGSRLTVRLAARDGAPAFAETRSFAVLYLTERPGTTLAPAAEAALRTVVAALAAGDERASRRGARPRAAARGARDPGRHDPTLDRDAYRAAVRELVRRDGRPRGVVLTVDSPCDLRCSFCTRGEGGIVPRHTTLSPVDDLRFQVDTLAGTGARRLDFGGDEPLSHPALPQIVRYARRRGFERLTVATAGVRLAEPGVAAELVAAGVTQVRVPLYGSTARVHDAITGRPGAFRRTVAGLRAALAAGLEVQLRTLALRANLASLAGLEPLAARLGLPPPTIDQVAPRSADAADFRRSVPSYAAVVRALRGTRLRVTGFPPCLRRLAGREADARFGRPERADRPPDRSPGPAVPWLAPHHPPRCRRCVLRPSCRGTYALYVAVHGDGELEPVAR
jgi:molybdenum cofactor biosynthesis enzyme MoaA